MAYECQSCSEKSTVNDIVNAVLKLGTAAVIIYVLFTYKDAIKESVDSAISDRKKLNGPKRKK